MPRDRMLGWLRPVLDHPIRALAVGLLIWAPVAAGILRLEVRTDGAALFPSGDPAVQATAADRWRFHEREQVIVLASVRGNGARLDSLAGLRSLRALHRSLEQVPGRGRLRSLATLPDPIPGTPLLQVGAFLDDPPVDLEARSSLLHRIRASPLASGLFLSRSGLSAALYIEVAGPQDRERFVAELEEWARAHRTPELDLRLTGPVTAEVRLGRAVLSDLAWLVPLLAAAIAGLLGLCLRTAGGVAIPLIEVLLVLSWTLGWMGWCAAPVTLVTTILPVLLMTTAITDEIHLIDRFQSRRAALRSRDPAGAWGRETRRQATESALGDVGRPIVLTSLTTAIAFLSFLSASSAPIRHFGIFTAIGVLAAMLSSLTLVPALLVALPDSWFRARLGAEARSQAPRLPIHHRLLIRRGGAAALAGLALLAGFVPGLSGLRIQDSWIGNFPAESETVTAADDFNRDFWGAYRFDVTLEGEDPLFFMSPEGLQLVHQVSEAALAGPYVGGVVSHAIHYQIAAEVLEQQGPVWELPRETVLAIARLLSRIQQRIDLDRYLRYDGSSARIRLVVKSPNYRRARELESHLAELIPPLLAGRNLRMHFSGDLPVARATVGSVVGNMLRSIAWTIAGVGVLLWATLWSLRGAGLAMVPLLTGIPVLFGAMGYAQVPLGIATSMFAALTIGIAVDFALHLIHSYRQRRSEGRDHESALRGCLESSGRAIHWNAIVLSVGLSFLALSDLPTNRSLGLLLAGGVAVCYGTTLLFLPWLLGAIRLPSDPDREPSTIGANGS